MINWKVFLLEGQFKWNEQGREIWEANSRAVNQEIPFPLWAPEFDYRALKISVLNPNLDKTNQVQIP
jgi:hypothetical protein